MKQKSRIYKKDLDAALNFLNNHPDGQCIMLAEHILTAMAKGKLPRVKQYIINANFDFREIIDSKHFQEELKNNQDSESYLNHSKTNGLVKVILNQDRFHFIMFYKPHLNKNEAALFSQNYSAVIRSIYSLLGIDMSKHKAKHTAFTKETSSFDSLVSE